MMTIRKYRKWLMAVLMVVPAMTYAAAPKWTEETIEEVYEDIRDYNENRQVLAEAEEKLSSMQEDLDLVKHRMSRKESALDQVESGQLSLTIAAEIFHEIDRENVSAYSMRYRPSSLAECAQARVIRFLRIRVDGSNDHSRLKAVLRRLDAEFQDRFGYPVPHE
jgi:hypothetical protein